MTTWPLRPRTPSTQHTWTFTRECAVFLFVTQVFVVLIHILRHLVLVCFVRACHVHTWSERISSTSSSILCKIAVFLRDVDTEWSTESGEKSWKQQFWSLPAIVFDVWNDDTMRRKVPFPFPTNWKWRALLRTRLSLWKTFLVKCWKWRLKIAWGADASSNRFQPETHITRDSMEGKGKGKSGKGKKGREKGTENPLRQRQRTINNQTLTITMENVEIVDSMDTACDCWYKQTNKAQDKVKGTGKSKSKV